MAASPINGDLPSTGFRRPSSNLAAVPQRSLSLHEKAVLAKDDADADILYTHPCVRIYHFQPPTDALASLDKTKKTLPDADYPIDAIEILPWRSRTETLSARAKLVIEKVQGSVHFLKCGSVIHTIMRNSQCWCVDGESKFVMRIGRLRYQRIEMPAAEPEDKKKVEEFKEVISKILKFEKTPCPFIRAFQVDLPEDAITPRRRGTWKRKESLTPVTPDGDSPIVRKAKTTRTMSMRGMPPSSFPSRSMTQIDMERPRTASTPTSHGRSSFPDIRSESPTTYTSGEEGTDSERHDSASDRAESSHNSEVDESDRETSTVPIIKSPLKNVETLSPVRDEHLVPQQDQLSEIVSLKKKEKSPIVASRIQVFNEYSLQTKQPALQERRGSLAAKELVGTGPSSGSTLARLVPEKVMEVKDDEQTQPEPGTKRMPDLRHKLSEPEPLGELKTDSTASVAPKADHRDISVNAHDKRPTTDFLSDESQDHDTTDTDSLYERLKAEVQKEVETVRLKSSQAKTIHAQDHQSSSGDAAPHLADSTVSPFVTGTTVLNRIPALDDDDEELVRTYTNDDLASTVSVDSFHTVVSDDDVYDPVSISGTWGGMSFSHRRELSELTVTADSTGVAQAQALAKGRTNNVQPVTPAGQHFAEEEGESWLQRRTPGAFDDEPELRERLQHQRLVSPLPPSSTVESARRTGQNDHIPAALLQKAATLAIVKPLELVMFLVHIFGRIAQGATVNDLLSGDLFRRPGVRRTASGTFEQNFRGRPTGRESEDEDDYAMPLRRKSSISQYTTSASPQKDDDVASFGSID